MASLLLGATVAVLAYFFFLWAIAFLFFESVLSIMVFLDAVIERRKLNERIDRICRL